MPPDKIYVSLGIKHVYFSNVAVEYHVDFSFLSRSNTATFWSTAGLSSRLAVLFLRLLRWPFAVIQQQNTYNWKHSRLEIIWFDYIKYKFDLNFSF